MFCFFYFFLEVYFSIIFVMIFQHFICNLYNSTSIFPKFLKNHICHGFKFPSWNHWWITNTFYIKTSFFSCRNASGFYLWIALITILWNTIYSAPYPSIHWCPTIAFQFSTINIICLMLTFSSSIINRKWFWIKYCFYLFKFFSCNNRFMWTNYRNLFNLSPIFHFLLL